MTWKDTQRRWALLREVLSYFAGLGLLAYEVSLEHPNTLWIPVIVALLGLGLAMRGDRS